MSPRMTLKAAFLRLTTLGFVAEEDYLCCTTCATDGCERQMAQRGLSKYVYYHNQNTEDAEQGNGLHLGFGSFGTDAESTAAGQEVVRVLKEHGLHPEWGGDWSQKIFLPIKWN